MSYIFMTVRPSYIIITKNMAFHSSAFHTANTYQSLCIYILYQTWLTYLFVQFSSILSNNLFLISWFLVNHWGGQTLWSILRWKNQTDIKMKNRMEKWLCLRIFLSLNLVPVINIDYFFQFSGKLTIHLCHYAQPWLSSYPLFCFVVKNWKQRPAKLCFRRIFSFFFLFCPNVWRMWSQASK